MATFWVADCFSIANGFLVTNCFLVTNGFMVANCFLVKNYFAAFLFAGNRVLEVISVSSASSISEGYACTRRSVVIPPSYVSFARAPCRRHVADSTPCWEISHILPYMHFLHHQLKVTFVYDSHLRTTKLSRP